MRLWGAALMVASVALLTSCTPTVPLLSETPRPATSATAVPVVGPSLRATPTLLYSLTCDELVPDIIRVEAFGDAGVHDLTLPDGRISPVAASVRQHGGLSCNLGNDEHRETASGRPNPAYKNLTIQLLPDRDSKWVKYATMGYPQDAAEMQFASGSATQCLSSAESKTCTSNVRVGSTWVELALGGIDAPDGTTDFSLLERMRPIIASIVERIPDPRVVEGVQPDVTMPPCEVVLPVHQVAGILAYTGDDIWAASHDKGGYSLMAAAREYSGVETCSVDSRRADYTIALVGFEVLPRGAWAFTPAEAVNGIAVGSERVDVPGTSAASYLRCALDGDECVLDLAVADNWVRVTLHQQQLGEKVTEEDRQSVLALGAMIATNLR
jgi:hypothetical protein